MDLMWLFTVPVLKLAIKIAIGLIAIFLSIQVFVTKDLFILNDWNESKGTAVVISINMKMYTCPIHNSIL